MLTAVPPVGFRASSSPHVPDRRLSLIFLPTCQKHSTERSGYTHTDEKLLKINYGSKRAKLTRSSYKHL